ncbi:hypothetical protein F8566_40960 [Actinomadura rudentiformis]|uniref:Uncharacterized protein n=1 Tax=Actinomadura rudentiformis TaxID=359158 RepID=A0A6H9YA78_9ACTN|nr:hypothetical protein F8566_40960 [Actinomadura rudentiformis]
MAVSSGDAPRARPVRPRLLALVCSFWSTANGACGGTDAVRPYVVGPRCRRHTPAALAGLPEPGPDRAPESSLSSDL